MWKAEDDTSLGEALLTMLTDMFGVGAPEKFTLRFIDASTYRDVKLPLQMLVIPNDLIVKSRRIVDAIN